MKTAVVTGASSGIGFEVCKSLINMGYKVYGIGINFLECQIYYSNFVSITCDITDLNKLCDVVKKIEREEEIHVLINSGAVGYFGYHEDLNPKKIHDMIVGNLEVPIILTNLLLEKLKKNKGHIINISSIAEKKVSNYSSAYFSIKAGITHFSENLFYETRESGLKVATIHPDISELDFYEKSSVSYEGIANAVEIILKQGLSNIVTDITIRPQEYIIEKK